MILQAGCAGGKPAPKLTTVPASGTVTYQGRPVAGAQLTFHGPTPEESGFAATNAKGEFRCMTNESGEGLVPGDYTVCIISRKTKIPEKYADPDSSPALVTVEEDSANQFPLELTD